MANDNEPNNVEQVQKQIPVEGEQKEEVVQVHVTMSKRRKLETILELLMDFTPREVFYILRVYSTRRKVRRLEKKDKTAIKRILAG